MSKETVKKLTFALHPIKVQVSGMRGIGKTTVLGIIAEALCKAGLSTVAINTDLTKVDALVVSSPVLRKVK